METPTARMNTCLPFLQVVILDTYGPIITRFWGGGAPTVAGGTTQSRLAIIPSFFTKSYRVKEGGGSPGGGGRFQLPSRQPHTVMYVRACGTDSVCPFDDASASLVIMYACIYVCSGGKPLV